MIRRAIIALWLCATCVAGVLPSDALAQPSASDRVNERLARGLELFGELEYRDCIRALAPVPKDSTATRAQRLRALELIGLSYLILGEEARAREAFEDLLAIDPGYQLRDDTGSPKIRDFFDAVKRAYVPGFDSEHVSELAHSAPVGAVAGRAVEVVVEVSRGADHVKSMVMLVRRRGVLGYSKPIELRRLADARWRARFDAPASEDAYVLEYYVEARNIAGGGVGRVGGPETPLALTVAAGHQPQRPWYQRRWYVIAGGAALVGIGTALIVTSGGDAPDGTLPPGRVTLSP
ncbi:MAG TPA: hypothetical protein VML75_19405 [Kofleriaceae bacterium]|nr:hypothetical protein [Kofleriaceae bacterium]